jgi:flagellar protein FliS
MSTNGYNAYKTIDVTTASPVKLTTMLFDGALKAIKKARLAFQNGDRQGFVDQTMKASDIVGELFVSLDMKQGELPGLLGDVYVYCIRRLGEATLDDPAKLDEVEMHLTRIASAWKDVTRKDGGQPGQAGIGGLAA